MIEALGPYAGYILSSYGLTGAVIAGLVAWVLIDHAMLTRRLKAMEERGIRRRSARPAASASEGRETA